MYERKVKDHVYMSYQVWNRILGRGMIGDISGGITLAGRHVLQVSIRSFTISHTTSSEAKRQSWTNATTKVRQSGFNDDPRRVL